jgi:hypothetical protein
MKLPSRRRLLIAAALAVVLAAYFAFSAFGPEASVSALALQEIAHRTSTPVSSWSIRTCNFDGEKWTVCGRSELGGKAVVTISEAGQILSFASGEAE